MSDRFTLCPLCHSKHIAELGKSYAHASLYRCADCRFVFSASIPSAAELQAHYSSYRRNNHFSGITRKRYLELLETLEPYRKHNRILDVGCGDGYFLETAKARGWEVYGTEFTTDAVEICRNKGITMFQGTILDVPQELEFDVVTTFEVIEHMNNGAEFAARTHALLRHGGLFYFTTPNFNSISRRKLKGNWRVIDYPEHLSYYTPSTITRLLRSNGFTKIRLITSGVSLQSQTTYRQAIESGNLAPDETLREKIENRFYMRWIKKVVNGLLSLTGTGDTLKGFFVKPYH
ncbi:MAG: class I SAM-dependent methyltransferase [Bacteroidetes bacterium]|nr:class I SAM-dependent methyltransferase [Bacteroidota bacterium]